MVRVHFGPPLQERKWWSEAKGLSDREFIKMDSKAGSWQQSGGLLQPAWLFRRKASPFWPTTSKNVRWKYGGLAQLGERLPCKQEVSGSIPLISTKRKEEIDWSSLETGDFIESLWGIGRFDCTLKTEHCELWCNYEKATVKETFFRVKYNFSQTRILLRWACIIQLS